MADEDLLRRLRVELKRLNREKEAAARKYRPKLEALIASRPESHYSGLGKHRRLLLLLEPWQDDAIRLLQKIQGGALNEKLRKWITAAILAEAGLLRSKG